MSVCRPFRKCFQCQGKQPQLHHLQQYLYFSFRIIYKYYFSQIIVEIRGRTRKTDFCFVFIYHSVRLLVDTSHMLTLSRLLVPNRFVHPMAMGILRDPQCCGKPFGNDHWIPRAALAHNWNMTKWRNKKFKSAEIDFEQPIDKLKWKKEKKQQLGRLPPIG